MLDYRWDHSEDWFVATYQPQRDVQSNERHIEINLSDENYDFMVGHVIDGRNLLPATGYLAFVWETIGLMKGKIHTTMPIIFQDISFIRATHLSNNIVKLTITIQKGIYKIITMTTFSRGSSFAIVARFLIKSYLSFYAFPICLLNGRHFL